MVQIGNKFLDAAFIMEGMVLFHTFSQVKQIDFQTLCQECGFAETLLQNVIFENSFFEDLVIGQEMHESTCDICFPYHCQRCQNIAAGIFLFVDLAVTVNLYHQPFRQGVYNGSTYPVQTAGNLISAAAKFTAGMENSKYHLQSRHPFLFIDIYGDPTAVIHNGNGIVGMDLYCDLIAEACQGFVHGVIYDFINQMMQTLGAGGTDIHTRTLTNCFQPFQDLNLICIIFG